MSKTITEEMKYKLTIYIPLFIDEEKMVLLIGIEMDETDYATQATQVASENNQATTNCDIFSTSRGRT